jgi:diguanylate cyclase (GGDEF)-like protein
VLWRALILLRVVQRQRRDLSHAARSSSKSQDRRLGSPVRASVRAAAWSQTTHTDLTIAMIDVDRFKEYNDQFGHQAGDEVLVDCALAWRSALPHEAYLARYGGDEFALLLPGLDTDEAEPVLDLLRLSTPQSVSASIGYAHHHPDTAIRQTLTEADAALYAAKAAGRDTVTGPNMTAVASSA